MLNRKGTADLRSLTLIRTSTQPIISRPTNTAQCVLGISVDQRKLAVFKISGREAFRSAGEEEIPERRDLRYGWKGGADAVVGFRYLSARSSR